MKLITSTFALFSTLLCSLSHANLLNINPATVEAESWTILDVQSGQTLASSQAHLQRAPASLTKMMTAYIVLKEIKAGRLDRNEVLTASPIVKTVQWDESQMYLKEGEQISIDRLLAALIIMSANDAAVSLAERVSGSIPSFVARMNQEAKALGMGDTHFSNPAGITMPDHFSSAHDIARLGQALSLETPEYLSYSKQLSFTYKQRVHRATNLVLKRDSSVDGLKTGFTKAAGYNLALTALRPDLAPVSRSVPASNSASHTTSSLPASAANEAAQTHTDDVDSAVVVASEPQQHSVNTVVQPTLDTAFAPQRRIIVVVMGAKSGIKRAEISENLLNLAYAYTRNQVAIKGKQFIAEVPVYQSTQKIFKVEAKRPQQVSTALFPTTQQIQFNQYNPNTHRLMYANANGNLSAIEPLKVSPTQLKVEIKANSLTAPINGLKQLAKVNVYQNQQFLQSFDIDNEIHIDQALWYERLWMWVTENLSLLA